MRIEERVIFQFGCCPCPASTFSSLPEFKRDARGPFLGRLFLLPCAYRAYRLLGGHHAAASGSFRVVPSLRNRFGNPTAATGREFSHSFHSEIRIPVRFGPIRRIAGNSPCFAQRYNVDLCAFPAATAASSKVKNPSTIVGASISCLRRQLNHTERHVANTPRRRTHTESYGKLAYDFFFVKKRSLS